MADHHRRRAQQPPSQTTPHIHSFSSSSPPSTSRPNAPFTPRSTTFPDTLDSDPEFDVFEPTPLHSPTGPRYDDLPPTYDEAQQQALLDARNGVPPLDPSEVHLQQRLHLNLDLRAGDEVREYRVPVAGETAGRGRGLVGDADAYEFQPENRRNGEGLGVSVAVQGGGGGAEDVPVGCVRSGGTRTGEGDAMEMLLARALGFTQHEPDADSRFAPRLTRSVAIPPVLGFESSKEKKKAGKKEVKGSGCGRNGTQDQNPIPGQWPESQSGETVSGEASGEEPAKFLRTYAKTLHAHSIRPAEFTEFLDGLNALCVATNTTPADLLQPDIQMNSPAWILRSFIEAANEAFFAPRGLRVSFQSLSTLVDAAKIPEERGQRAGAVVSALDEQATPERRAQALHPWIEALESNVPEPSAQMLLLREMSERFRVRSGDSPPRVETHRTGTASSEARSEQQSSDPPHSIPELPANAQEQPNPHPPSGGQWATPWFAPWGLGGRGRWSSFNTPANGTFSTRGNPNGGRGFANGNEKWTAWADSWCQWGDEWGKQWEQYGEQFEKKAEELQRKAEAFESRIEGRAPPQNTRSAAGPSTNERASAASMRGPEGLAGQTTGVLRTETEKPLSASPSNEKIKEDLLKKLNKKDHDDDDDASSISSGSSDSSSDSDSDSEEDLRDPEKIFHSRVRQINESAETSARKGKKDQAEIFHEREVAIEKAQRERTALEQKIEAKKRKRELRKEWRAKKRELRKEWKEKRRELRRGGENKGKGKEKKRENKAVLREAKKVHRQRVKQLRREMMEVRKGLKEEQKNLGRGQGLVADAKAKQMVWVVVENLGV